MAASPKTLLWRLGVIAALGLFATATITFAATKRIQAGSPAQPKVVAPVKREPLVVPDVRGKPYVFAKGILDDAGFAWRVSTKNGYATNVVSSQTPAPGTRVVDTGAPLLVIALQGTKGEAGSPENAAPYESTLLRLVSGRRIAAPARVRPSRSSSDAVRKPDFVVPGAPKERGVSLPQRAQRLAKVVEQHRERTPGAVAYWRSQHDLIVKGARWGWWHGAQALRILIKTDRRVRALWRIDTMRATVARRALAEVEGKA